MLWLKVAKSDHEERKPFNKRWIHCMSLRIASSTGVFSNFMTMENSHPVRKGFATHLSNQSPILIVLVQMLVKIQVQRTLFTNFEKRTGKI